MASLWQFENKLFSFLPLFYLFFIALDSYDHGKNKFSHGVNVQTNQKGDRILLCL